MEFPSIDDIFKEMRLANKKPIASSVDCGGKNNSDMHNNLVMMRTESNKDCSKFVVPQEASLAIQKHARSNKTAMLDFSESKGPISE
jgi:hypothetical protein